MSSFQQIFSYSWGDEPVEEPKRSVWLPPEDEFGTCVPLSIVGRMIAPQQMH